LLEPLELYPEQEAAVEQMLSNTSGAVLLGSAMGTGKTPICVEYCLRFDTKTVLIIAPLQTMGKPIEPDDEKHEGWQGTFERQGSSLSFRQIDSTKTGKQALADLQWGVPGVYFIGQQLFSLWGWENIVQRNGEKKKVRTKTWDIDVDVLIYDEVHRAQNGQSATSKTLTGSGMHHKGAPKAKTRIGASGTYEGNSFDGAWAVTRWLWPDRIDANQYAWRRKWAKTEYDHFAVRNERVVGELEPGAFVASLPCYIRIEADFDVEIVEREFHVDLYPQQRQVYDELEEQMVAWIHDNPLVVKYPITKRTRQRQATLGMPLVEYNDPDDPSDVEVSFADDCLSSKIDATYGILEEFFEGEPALIFTDSQKFARVLTKRLNKRYGEVAREWSGKIPRATRNADKADFLSGKYKYMVCVIAAIGVGTDGLQGAARSILYMSSSDDRITNEQSVARLVRDGQKSEFVRVARLIAKDTIDAGQLSKHIQDALDANKRAKVKR
jgi:hypothetical protein